MRTCVRVSPFVLLMLLSVGCSTTLVFDDTHESIRNLHAGASAEDYDRVAAINDCEMRLYDSELSALETAHPGHPHRFERGLALSGGGMRSGSFAMGILEELHERDELKTIDVASSVSGGGYALGWYLMHMTDASTVPPPEREAAILQSDGPYQKLIGSHANLTPKLRTLRYVAADLFPAGLWNLFANGVFGWHLNTSPGRHFYEDRLREAFGTEPTTAGGTQAIRLTWEEYREAVASGRIPVFVVNATAFLDENVDSEKDTLRLARTNYEITPWHHGNDALGYVCSKKSELCTLGPDLPFDLPRAMSISGGALDLVSITPGFTQKLLVSALNLDIGYSIENPGYERPLQKSDAQRPHLDAPCGHRKLAAHGVSGKVSRKERILQMLTPFPFYLGRSWYERHKGGSAIYLSDGGFADNLGAYSLIRRMTRQIVIVDGELENAKAGYRFDSYRALKEAVASELHADLRIPTLDAIIENRATFDPHKPVMAGKITEFPTRTQTTPAVVQVMYVKLSMIDDLDKYPEVVRSYYKNRGMQRKDPFPQESTGDQRYDDERFRAYRALGQTIASCIPPFGEFVKYTNAGKDPVDPECYAGNSTQSASR